MKVDVYKLKIYEGTIYNDGYRLVYRKNNELLYGSYAKEIEGFIYETYPYNPYPYYINDEEIVFTTVEDLLERLLKMDSNKNIDEVFIYKVNGEFISSYSREKGFK